MREPNQMHQYWSLAAAAALVYAVWLVQSPAAKQPRAEAASIQTAFIQPLPLPTESENPLAKMSDGELLRIASADFRRHFMAIESIRDRVMAELSHIAKYLLFAVVAGSGAQMLAFYLWRLCETDAEEIGGQYRIRSKVLQPEVASLLNLSREHVTRLFARLQEQGVVGFNRGHPLVDKAWIRNAIADKDLADSIVYRDYPK